MKNLFKKTATIASLALVFFVSGQSSFQNVNINFKENKGQIHDQNNKQRSDILFNGSANGMDFYIGLNGVSYQLTKVTSWKEILERTSKPIKVASDLSIYRIDISWLNAKKDPLVLKGNEIEGFDNFYLPNIPNGILDVKSYSDILFKDVYSGIDLKWYQKNDALEYDFVVAPNADYSVIKMKIEGANTILIGAKGELIIATPFGEIIEEAPIVYQGKTVIISGWIVEGNIVSFKLGKYNKALPLIIDPVIRNWGTYYGGAGADYIYGSACDNSGNVYVTGNSASSNVLATTGSHQTNIVGGPISGILTKFNSNGVRQWGTYYGGAGAIYAQVCSVFSTNEVYMAGYTTSTVNVSTPSSHQSSYGGGSEDGFLVKFNASGVRQWATYYGGVGNDRIYGCSTDINGNVFACGTTQNSTGTVIATIGSHQATIGSATDAFAVKFNSSGVRQWGTYYGGSGNFEIANACATDNAGNLYITGETTTPTNTLIASVSSHQTVYGGIQDGFLAKFNASGVRQWGTYYGGAGADISRSCVVDASGNIVICGLAQSLTSTLIASSGSHQTSHGGGTSDGFIAKFNAGGVRQWGTYYGGFQADDLNSIATDASSNYYLIGYTNSSNGISTANSYQLNLNGSDDNMILKFNTSGVRQWSTYYGGNQYEYGQTINYNNGNIYFGGYTTSNTGTSIASPSSHQPAFGGSVYDAFYAQLYECNFPSAPTDITPVGNLTLCALTHTTSLSASGSGTISWYNVPSGGSSLASGTTFVSPTLTAGSYTYYAEAFTCTNSISRTAVTFTVLPLPSVSIVASPSVLCVGQFTTVTLTANGASNYSWSTSANGSVVVVSPTTTTSYSVIGTDGNGCSDSYSISILVSPCTSILSNDAPKEIPLVIYPNPTSGDLYINVEQKCDLVIYNAIGQIQQEVRLSEGNNEVNLQDLNRGIYLLRITQNKLIVNKKVIKQ